MQDLTGLFIELGHRMRRFGADERSQRCIAEAVAANGWFTPGDMRMAAGAIREEFLDGEKLRRWLSGYDAGHGVRRSVAVIMAGNIPFVGFFDMMCALLCGHEVYVKPSRKDAAAMEYVIGQLLDMRNDLPLRPFDGSRPVDMAIATGGDIAASHFRALFSGIPALIRGSRHSVAVLAGDETGEELRGLQKDVFSYSGLGCRNVSLVFVPRGASLALQAPVKVNPMLRDNYTYTRAMLAMGGTAFADRGGYVAVESRGFSDALSRVNYSFYDDTDEVRSWLREHDGEVQCVVSRCVDHPRRAAFGRAQYPSLSDYADGADVMDFLLRPQQAASKQDR